MNKVKNRRISEPSHVRMLISEQINILRQDETLDKIEVARAIAYLSNTSLSAYRDGELLEKVKAVETMLKEKVD